MFVIVKTTFDMASLVCLTLGKLTFLTTLFLLSIGKQIHLNTQYYISRER